jgi:hypothetical protein
MKFAFIARYRAIWQTLPPAHALSVSRGGFCDGLRLPPSCRTRGNPQALVHVRMACRLAEHDAGEPSTRTTCRERDRTQPAGSAVAGYGSRSKLGADFTYIWTEEGWQ